MARDNIITLLAGENMWSRGSSTLTGHRAHTEPKTQPPFDGSPGTLMAGGGGQAPQRG